MQMVAEKEVTATSTGKAGAKRVRAQTVEPGERLFYTILVHNSGRAAAKDLVVDNPVPDGAVYVPGSAGGKHCRISISTDHGSAYRREDDDTLPEDVTDLRWTIGVLPGGGKRKLTFEVMAISRDATRLTRAWNTLYGWLSNLSH